MNKKYELVKTNREDGLFQIKALREGPWGPVGTFGGFVRSENNLSHRGECWISDNAEVYETARVSENAIVSGTTRVRGDAQVFETARVSRNAIVSGNAKVYGNAQICGNSLVFGKAEVSGNAWVYGNAQIFRHAKISGRAQISAGKHTKSPLHIEGSKDYNTVCTAEVVNVGCESYPIDFWLENAQSIGKENNYSEEEINEYTNYFKYIKSVLEG
jgi:NDP-sugar pyrophosphorylase family protein